MGNITLKSIIMNVSVISLLKFGEEEHIRNLLLKGEICMNTISLFKNYEQKEIGDKYEGAFKVKNYVNAKLTVDLPNSPITLHGKDFQFTQHHKNHIGNIYSTYAISNLLLKRKNVHRIDRRMIHFGDYWIIITDVPKFISLINYELDSMGINCEHNIVKYRNYSKNEHDLGVFNKSHLFSYQKEHRIVAWSKEEKQLKFNIGSLEGFAELYRASEVIDSLVVDYN